MDKKQLQKDIKKELRLMKKYNQAWKDVVKVFKKLNGLEETDKLTQKQTLYLLDHLDIMINHSEGVLTDEQYRQVYFNLVVKQ